MNITKLMLLIAYFVATAQIGGISQTSIVKPKIMPKPVSTSSKKSVTPKAVSVPSKAAKIKFENVFINLGTIKEDAVIEKSFEFTNIGERDLVVINTKGSCGCTIPTASSEPIPPGGKGKIMVKYTAKNKVGPQKPVVTVTTNGVPSIIKLNMEAWVEQIPGGVNEK